jgi:hypothetical protein
MYITAISHPSPSCSRFTTVLIVEFNQHFSTIRRPASFDRIGEAWNRIVQEDAKTPTPQLEFPDTPFPSVL